MSSVILEIDASPKFTFLTPPPPPKKKRAAVNNTFRAPASSANRFRGILTWANDIHPGSPPPTTPMSGASRNSSFQISSPLLRAFRRSSLSRAKSCRQFTTHARDRIPSNSSPRPTNTPQTPVYTLHTPFPADAKVDLTAFGYASTFVDIPISTPITPEIYRSKPTTHIPSRRDATTVAPSTTLPLKSNAPGMFKRLLGTAFASSKRHSSRGEGSFESVDMYKRELYADVLPPVTPERAERKDATARINGGNVFEGVWSVHRGDLGGIWWNYEEGQEFVHLLSPTKAPLSAQYPDAEGWVTYNHLKEFEREDSLKPTSFPSSKYTGSYHPRPSLVTGQATENLVHGLATRCSSIAGSIVFPSPSTKPSNVLLAIPSRPRRGKHLKLGFLNDVVAVPPTPVTPSASCHLPRSPARATRFIINTNTKAVPTRQKRSRSRSLPRRQRKLAPPPLKIVPTRSINKVAVNVGVEEEDRKIFAESKPGFHMITSQWSRGTTTPGSSPAWSGGFVDNFTLASDVPRKSRRFGGFFGGGGKF